MTTCELSRRKRRAGQSSANSQAAIYLSVGVRMLRCRCLTIGCGCNLYAAVSAHWNFGKATLLNGDWWSVFVN